MKYFEIDMPPIPDNGHLFTPYVEVAAYTLFAASDELKHHENVGWVGIGHDARMRYRERAYEILSSVPEWDLEMKRYRLQHPDTIGITIPGIGNAGR